MIKKTDQQNIFEVPTSDGEGVYSRDLNTGNALTIALAEGNKSLRGAVNSLVVLYSYARRGYIWDFIDEYTRRPIATMVDIFGSHDLEYGKVEETRVKWLKKRAGKYALYNPFLNTNIKEWMEYQKPLSKALYDQIYDGVKEPVNLKDYFIEMGTRLPVGFVQKYKKVKKYYKEMTYKATKGKEGFHSRAFGDEDNLIGLANKKVRSILGLKKSDSDIADKLDTRKEKRGRVLNYVERILDTSGING
jgi:hypothetical protein